MGSHRKLERWFDTAVRHQVAGELVRAEALYRRILSVAPASVPTLINLGLVLKSRGAFAAAEGALRRALDAEPDNPECLNNLGGVLIALDRADEGFNYFRRALKLRPDYAHAHVSLGTALRAFGRVTEASQHLQRAIELDPSSAEAHRELATVLRERGHVDEARARFDHAIALAPDDVGLRVRRALLVPVIPDSDAQLARYRQDVADAIDRLTAERPTIHNPIVEVGRVNFYMAYHGLDDRPIQEAIARFYEAACPSLSYVAPHCRGPKPTITGRRIRIGCISRYFRDHAITWTFRHYFDVYPADRFEIYLYTFEREENEIWNEMSARAHASAILPECDLARARRMIARDKLDVLIYPDIGMEPCTYFLAFARLAHVQCVAGGHPVTTGIGTLDYWIGNDLGEPEDGADHYSEQLLRVRGITNYYRRPVAPERLKERAALGLPVDGPLYVCAQSLFKLHPEFDDILGAILRAVPHGVVALFEAPVADWTKLLLERLHRSIPDVVDRVLMLPRMPFADFLNVLARADVMLDTTRFSGGNTSFQGLGLGTPIVTYADRYARGRVTVLLYRHMGLLDCVAESHEAYVEIATRLGRDQAERVRVSREILARCGVLFDNAEGTAELRDFFLDLFTGGAAASDGAADVPVHALAG